MMQGDTTRAATLGDRLWALVATLLARFTALFGALDDLDPAERRIAAAWLGDLEALARRLLFAAAVKWAAGKTYKRRAPADAGGRAGFSAGSSADAPPSAPAFRIGFCARRTHRGPPSNSPRAAAHPPAALARRAQALALLLAAPAPYARKLARRMAHRRELAPAMLLAMRRHRPRRHLRRVLAPLFGEPPELLVGMVSTPPPRAGPYAVTLPPDLGRPLAPAPRASARRLCAPAVTQAAAPDDVRPAAQRRRA